MAERSSVRAHAPTDTLTRSTANDAARVLRNTYALLSMTLLFSAGTAAFAMTTNAAPLGFLAVIIGFYGLLFLTHKTSNSAWGLLSVFALTGFMGYTLGPILSLYLAMPGGDSIVMNAFGLTGVAFLGLSGVALVTRKDFGFLGGFLTAGFFVLIGAMVLGFFMQSSALSLAISAGFVVFSSAAILYQTSAIINGGERNYILATVTLFVSIYNLLLSLLHLLTALGGDD